jgi:inosose dehydratase
MIIGCFALVEPFTPIAHQFRAIRKMGIEYADLTDNHNGGMLGVEYGFTASVSLDSHPAAIRRMAEEAGITLTTVCAHANLLDPASPDRYGTFEIIKAIRLAHLLGIKHVITAEGDPKTPFGHNLTPDERIFSLCEKLYEPVRWAEELDIELLLEPHGIVTGSVPSMAAVLDKLGHESHVGVCLDTGNSWLAGSEPMDYIEAFGRRIKHVHWKDLSSEWEGRRGTLYGCGMSMIPLGDGVVGIKRIVKALQKIGFSGATTLEIVGVENVKLSVKRLKKWSQT